MAESNALLILITNMTEDKLEKVIRFSTVCELWMEFHRLFDRGSEYKVYDDDFSRFRSIYFMRQKSDLPEKIKQRLMMTYAPEEQNGGSVRENRTLLETVHSVMHAHGNIPRNNEDHDTGQDELRGDEEEEEFTEEQADNTQHERELRN
ncbi:hypothetical protein PR048_026771 [Dryococelus australis]|uniref:Uncharacterized protein n=1 Tax=Dryococelus australis TaxID=614101 RepID=A0ABQ9GMA1_9NEOP|nr:hypothetical protein PR048_026771 [Dryococelus australis]